MSEIERKRAAQHAAKREFPVCPRCLGFVPNNEMPGAYPGALSRLTRGNDDSKWVFVCSACGVDEAMGNGLVPMDEWPIMTPTSPTRLPAPGRMVHDGENRNRGLE